MTRSYVITLRMDVDERADHPSNWDWATLVDLPDSGGVELIHAAEMAPLDEFSPEHEVITPLDSKGSAEVNYTTAGFRSNK